MPRFWLLILQLKKLVILGELVDSRDEARKIQGEPGGCVVTENWQDWKRKKEKRAGERREGRKEGREGRKEGWKGEKKMEA